MLSAASSVFKVMLGPNFLEGQQMANSAGPVEIELHDDDATAMSEMCNIMHFKPAMVSPKQNRSKSLLALAVVVDKYACVHSLRLQSQGLVLRYFDEFRRNEVMPLYRMAAASYLLDEPMVFRLATQRLVTHTNGDYSSVLTSEDGLYLPFDVFSKLQLTRRA